MASKVYFADLRTTPTRNLLDKVGELLDKVELSKRIKAKGTVAIKLHFGERGNTAYVRPVFLRRIVDRVKELGGRPFLTDTCTSTVVPGPMPCHTSTRRRSTDLPSP
jgi:uncharacterized Fe-S center protein